MVRGCSKVWCLDTAHFVMYNDLSADLWHALCCHSYPFLLRSPSCCSAKAILRSSCKWCSVLTLCMGVLPQVFSVWSGHSCHLPCQARLSLKTLHACPLQQLPHNQCSLLQPQRVTVLANAAHKTDRSALHVSKLTSFISLCSLSCAEVLCLCLALRYLTLVKLEVTLSLIKVGCVMASAIVSSLLCHLSLPLALFKLACCLH